MSYVRSTEKLNTCNKRKRTSKETRGTEEKELKGGR